MDVSQVQSGSKCSSDFSIERILSEDSRRSREESAAPSWLCCTRYRPPRLPRAVNSNACRARRSGRHARVPFTASQAQALEAAYARAPYLAPPALRALAAALHLRDDRIKIWFQNRRARERREKCSNIAPPHAVTLPPTTMPQGAMITVNSPWIPNTKKLPTATIQLPIFANRDNINAMIRGFPHDLSNAATPAPLLSNSFSEDSDEDRSLGARPETPLDIETLED